MKTSFRRNGFDHQQCNREGNLAIFRRQLVNGRHEHYEVVRIRAYGAAEVGGRHIPAGERYPSSEEWGRMGWTCATLPDAQAKLASLTKSTIAE